MTVIEIKDGYVVSLDGVYAVNLNQGSSVEITDDYTIQINNAKGDEGTTGQNGNNGIDGIGRKIGNYISGRYYPIVGTGIPATFTTLALAANRIDLSPVTITETITPSEIGAMVTSGGASGVVFKIIIYSSGANGFPDSLFWESESLNGTGTNVFRFSTASMPTLQKGATYWVGTFAVQSLTVRALPVAGLFQIGGIGTTATTANFGTSIQYNAVPFYPAAPNPFPFTSSQITNNIAAPLILIKP
jgi:hypothetical protein